MAQHQPCERMEVENIGHALQALSSMVGNCGRALTGVATTTSGEVRSVAACTFSERPPTTSATRMSVYCARFVIMLCTCAASELSLSALLA